PRPPAGRCALALIPARPPPAAALPPAWQDAADARPQPRSRPANEQATQPFRINICGIEKSGVLVDYARQLARHDILEPGDLLVCDEQIIGRVVNANNARAYGKETYWGRKFVYRALDGRVVVPTVPPPTGAPYDANGGQANPAAYPTLPAILDVIDRTGSSMYVDGIIPVAAAHGKAAFPIGVGTDVLRLVATKRLGLNSCSGQATPVRFAP
uniref:hypothetical protein n=1 Tax=Streptomyces sp. YIM 98790 TaxID=2689077 RepID=UPI001A9E2931